MRSFVSVTGIGCLVACAACAACGGSYEAKVDGDSLAVPVDAPSERLPDQVAKFVDQGVARDRVVLPSASENVPEASVDAASEASSAPADGGSTYDCNPKSDLLSACHDAPNVTVYALDYDACPMSLVPDPCVKWATIEAPEGTVWCCAAE